VGDRKERRKIRIPELESSTIRSHADVISITLFNSHPAGKVGKVTDSFSSVKWS
jgi:hypothetical protein